MDIRTIFPCLKGLKRVISCEGDILRSAPRLWKLDGSGRVCRMWKICAVSVDASFMLLRDPDSLSGCLSVIVILEKPDRQAYFAD